jgi:hypothetical protein
MFTIKYIKKRIKYILEVERKDGEYGKPNPLLETIIAKIIAF